MIIATTAGFECDGGYDFIVAGECQDYDTIAEFTVDTKETCLDNCASTHSAYQVTWFESESLCMCMTTPQGYNTCSALVEPVSASTYECNTSGTSSTETTSTETCLTYTDLGLENCDEYS
jgi:hypothetical protein